MRWRGVSHVEFAVLDYDQSIAFYDAMFGWLGYSSFSTLGMEYQSIYYMTRFVNPHSYIGIQPSRTGTKLKHTDQSVGINHIALWARSRREVDHFRQEFLTKQDVQVTDGPAEYPQYWPGYYAVFFDDPVNGIRWELAWIPKVPAPQQILLFYRALRAVAKSRADLANTVPGLAWQAMRTLPAPEVGHARRHVVASR
jgi:catechol 2,3-dioxygenase-like lactoylglutathione lyase family enzyme